MSADQSQVELVKLKSGQLVRAGQVVLTTGTFLRGMIHIGNVKYPAGRHRRDSDEVEPASIGLADTIAKIGFRLGRCKTGTPPRLHIGSVDFSGLEVQ